MGLFHPLDHDPEGFEFADGNVSKTPSPRRDKWFDGEHQDLISLTEGILAASLEP